MFQGAGRRLEREHNGRMESAWVGEMLARRQKLPKLLALLTRSSRRAGRRFSHDREAEAAALEAWAASFSR